MHRSRTILALLALTALVVALAACAAPSTSTPSAGGNTITLQNLAFNPSTLTVKVGDTVTFNNADSAPHHIVVGTTDLGEQQPGQTTTWKAPADGVYMLKCLIHPTMSGQITVGAGGSTVGTPATGGGSMGTTGGGTGGGTAPGY